ncbi:MAG: ABC transporter ATP-binding protein [Vulcanimicrobiaceae bacterium]
MIELRDVGLTIDGRMLLRNVSAQIAHGDFVAVLGPNGVGKTTLLRAVTGVRPHSDGSIVLDGDAIECLSPSQRARRIAFVTSDDALTDALLVNDVVAIARFAHHRWWEWSKTAEDEAAVERALAAVRMEQYRERLFSTLSSGERQRVWIAMGLAQETPVLVLDEPTSHLDVRVAHKILALLREVAQRGRAVICVLHDLNEAAAYADRLMLLGCDRLLAFDRPDIVLASGALEEAYGIEMERVRLPDGRLRVFAREGAP